MVTVLKPFNATLQGQPNPRNIREKSVKKYVFSTICLLFSLFFHVGWLAVGYGIRRFLYNLYIVFQPNRGLKSQTR